MSTIATSDATPSDETWPGITVSTSEGIMTVQLDRPAARNALGLPMIEELTSIARRVRRDTSVHAVILTGHSDFFSAGIDLQLSASRNASASSLLELRAAVAAGPDLCQAWEEIEAITIVAIEGYCVGGALALALSCDFRIMGESSFVRLPEVPLGLNMSWRTLPRLEALVGPSVAKQIVIFGDRIDAATCELWGLANVVCQDGLAQAEARRWAQRVSALPPVPVRMTKEAINAAANATAAASSYMDRDQYLVALRTEDCREGIQAFLERRQPSFKGN